MLETQKYNSTRPLFSVRRYHRVSLSRHRSPLRLLCRATVPYSGFLVFVFQEVYCFQEGNTRETVGPLTCVLEGLLGLLRPPLQTTFQSPVCAANIMHFNIVD